MLDWLRRDPRELPRIEVDGRTLPVVMRRTASARRMTMRLAPDGSEVRITLPRWGRSGEALEFARSRAELEQFLPVAQARLAPGGRDVLVNKRRAGRSDLHVPLSEVDAHAQSRFDFEAWLRTRSPCTPSKPTRISTASAR